MAEGSIENEPGSVAPPQRPSSLLGLLRHRYFRRIWAVTTVSSLGDWVGVFALTAYVADLSGRPEFAVGGVLLFRVVPGLFFGPFAGVLADRFDRRRLMVTADVTRALLIASIPFIHNLWGLYMISAALEVLQLLWAPAKDATVPNLVEREQLMTANQLSLITTYATFPLGGALVALLAVPAAFLSRFELFAVLESNPYAIAFFFDGASFLFSAFMVATFPAHLMRVKRAGHVTAGRWNPFYDLREGLRFIGRTVLVRTLVLAAWIAFTGGSAVVSLGPIFARQLVGSEAARQAAWGALITTVGVGLVSGMILAGVIGRRFPRDRIFPVGLGASGVGTVITASMTSITPALASTVLIGFGAGIAWVTIFTLLQETVDDRLRGRTFAALYTGIHLSLLIGLAGWPLIAGGIGRHQVRVGDWLVDLSGYRIVLWAGGVFMMLSALHSIRSMREARGVRRPRGARLSGLRFSRSLAGGARRGLFIVFEGVEGAGKSTHMKLLYEWLRREGREVVVTREPGGTPISERIRNVLLDPASKEMDPKTEAMLFAASRAQHVAQIIRPALESGMVVLCDRYIDSSLAYQGLVRGLGESDVLGLNTWATDDLLPDLVLLLHLDPQIGLQRLQGDPDRMEQEDVAFHQSVADAYLRLARSYPSRYAIVDASGSIESVQQQIRAAVLPFMQEPVPR